LFGLGGKRFSSKHVEAAIASVVESLPRIREDANEIETVLLRSGYDPFLAAKLSDLFPEACGHVLLRNLGATLLDEYSYRAADGSERKARFSRDGVWKVLVSRIEDLVMDEPVRARLAVLAETSAVVDCTNAALAANDSVKGAAYALAFPHWPRKS
jgi:hypothetical protein